jgi:hypothetical protein
MIRPDAVRRSQMADFPAVFCVVRLWNKTERFIVLYEAAPDARLYWAALRDEAGADRPPFAVNGLGEGRAA